MQSKFSLLYSKCIFKAPLNSLYVLWLMIHDTYIFMEYETGITADHVVLVKLLIFSKNSFTAIIQIYFQISSERLIGFIAWKVFKYGTFSGFYFSAFGLNTEIYCVNSVQIRSFSWFVFSCIRTEYGDLLREKSRNTEIFLVRIFLKSD